MVIPKRGFDIRFLKSFKKLIEGEIKKGKKFVLIVGGGATCRAYQNALGKVTKVDDSILDWMGIHTTYYNAQFVRLMFGDLAYKEVVMNPTGKIRTRKPIIVGSGWKPGCSSDKDAVLAAKTYGSNSVINISNVSHVFDKDPNKYKSARPIERLSWDEYLKKFGVKWKPGMSAPFGIPAAKLAGAGKIVVSIVDGGDSKALSAAIAGKPFEGTLIG